jgi:phosphoribosylamine---glycine ligase
MQYKGILYAGLMITADGPFVVEYNVRFGDPETQVVLPLLKTDLIDIFMAIAETRLDSLPIEWHNGSCICVVMASGGYPGAMETGFPITGIAEAEATGLSVIQAGTKLTDGQLVSSGGRVLGIVSRQDNLQKAIDAAYANIEKVHFKGVHYRHDIGQKALPK